MSMFFVQIVGTITILFGFFVIGSLFVAPGLGLWMLGNSVKNLVKWGVSS